MSTLKLKFYGFYNDYRNDVTVFPIWSRLFKNYTLEFLDDNSTTIEDISIISFWPCNSEPKGKIKLFFVGETWSFDPSRYNFLISHYHQRTISKARNLRWPLFNLGFDINRLKNKELKPKTKFCCFIVSNPNCHERNEMFHFLSKYKKVDSGGRHLNNMGYVVASKHCSQEIIDFISDYKFCICFENNQQPGYTTEKLVQTMIAGTIPIYWGDPTVGLHFNTNSFVYLPNFSEDSKLQALIEVVKLDSNDQLYKEKFNLPWTMDKFWQDFDEENLIKYGDEIASNVK